MATNYNYFGNLVTSGLVLDLDAAKLASYPGTGTTWYDISGNGNNGTLTNGPAFTGIGKQAAIVFDGTDDYTVISSSALLAAGTNDFCADFWLYPTSYPTLANPVSVTATTNGMWIGRNGSNFVLRAYAVADRIQNPILPTTSSWTNVSITRNGTNNIMYYNGAPSATSASNQNYAQFSTYIGSDGPGGGGATYFNGRIASSKYYNRGLSQFEVWQNFNAIKGRYGIPDIVTNGLVLNLDAGNPYSYLSGSSGTTWTNTVAVSSSISGTLVNGPVYANGAITLDGTDDYIQTNAGGINANVGTFNIWVKTGFASTDSLPRYLIDTRDSTNTQNISLYYYSVQNGFVVYGNDSLIIQSPRTFSTNTYMMVTLTYDFITDNYNFYVNSVLQGTSTSAKSSSGAITKTTIGSRYNQASSEYFTGNIFTTQIYNRALSAAEITQNFNALRGRYGI